MALHAMRPHHNSELPLRGLNSLGVDGGLSTVVVDAGSKSPLQNTHFKVCAKEAKKS